jgi:hypothetical protein
MKLCLLVLQLGILASAQDYDLVIRGGRIVDGTGNPSYLGDVASRQGKIVAMGRPSGTAARTIDATGLTVAPGFIDIHNHSDFTIVQDGNAKSMIRQGVTSMIFGEGGSAAPADAGTSTLISRSSEQGISTNIGTYVGSRRDLDIWCTAKRTTFGGRTRPYARAGQRVHGAGRWASPVPWSGPPGSWIRHNTLVAMCGWHRATAAYTPPTCGPKAAASSNPWRGYRDRGAPVPAWTSFTSRSPSTRCGARCLD